MRPTKLPYKELYDYDQAAEFVADYLTYEVLHSPNKLVSNYIICISVTLLATLHPYSNFCIAFSYTASIHYLLPQPEKLVSPSLVLRQQKGNSFDHSVLLCSLLLGVGYDAYCVCGYATREMCMMDQSRNICPLLEDKVKVHRNIVSEC